MLSEQQRNSLVAAARAATAKAFQTAPGGASYGAAVLTASGKVYTAGQYSSYNHVTNVHAEQGALVIATMADDLDILALAVAGTSQDPVTRPCGICRQILAEHAARTARDCEVLMAHRHDPGHERALVSELIPWGWTPQSRLLQGNATASPYRETPVRAGWPLDRHPPQIGDHVVLSDGSIAVVWDGAFEAHSCLVKIKYAPPVAEGRRKLSHSFTEPIEYQRELRDLGWARPTPCGALTGVVTATDIQGVLPMLPLDLAGERVPGPLLELLSQAGVDTQRIHTSGSRSIGLPRKDSDWDLVVCAEAEQIAIVRSVLFDALGQEKLTLPPGSRTWRLLDRLFPGGQSAILAERRYIDTIRSGDASAALIFVPVARLHPCLAPTWYPAGRGLFHGTVVDAVGASYKRAEYVLETTEAKRIRVTCYHKAANLLRRGDVISVRGWLLCCGDQQRLIQLLSVPDNIVWLNVARG